MASPYGSEREKGSNAPLRRLILAGVIFLGCYVGKTQFATQTEPYFRQLQGMLTASTDWNSIFEQVGAQMESGETVVMAVEDWCVAVFAPQDGG